MTVFSMYPRFGAYYEADPSKLLTLFVVSTGAVATDLAGLVSKPIVRANSQISFVKHEAPCK